MGEYVEIAVISELYNKNTESTLTKKTETRKMKNRYAYCYIEPSDSFLP